MKNEIVKTIIYFIIAGCVWQKEESMEEVKHLISIGKEKGSFTYEELNNALPADVVSSEQIDNIMIRKWRAGY